MLPRTQVKQRDRNEHISACEASMPTQGLSLSCATQACESDNRLL